MTSTELRAKIDRDVTPSASWAAPASMDAWAEIVAAVGEASGPAQALTIVLGRLLPLAGSLCACVYRQEGDQWSLVAQAEEAMAAIPWPPTLEYTPDALAQATEPASLIPADAALDADLAEALRIGRCDTVLVVPLKAHSAPAGRLLLGLAAARQRDLPPDAWLHALSNVLGLLVENARLSDGLRQQLRESQTIYEVSRAFVTTLDLDTLLDLIVRSAVDTIENAENCVLHLLDEISGELHPRALSFGELRSDSQGRSGMRIGQGVAGFALEMGQVINVPDVSRDARFIRVGQVRSFASMMVAPLKMGDHRIGTLSVDSPRRHAFSGEDERLLMTLATQAATGIENARLVRDVQQSLQDLKATQAQLIQSEKLSAIGQLIAGVAHELNNPLTAVMGYTQLLQTTDCLDESMARDLSKIYAQAQRAAKIVQNLLTFARQHRAERQFVNINEVLERTLELRSYQLRVENIEIITEFDRHVLGTMADPNQLQQVFLNLINNAEDAMVAYRGGGTLTVRTALHGEKVRAVFRDDGPGLSPQARQHLFEPFFTTKEVGKGTGLGLSICFGIISQHEGTIWADSETGQGTTFVVELPLMQEKPAALGDDDDTADPRIQSKRVLVVEDEEDVAIVLERILLQDGHRVLWAENGDAALSHLAQARRGGTRFDLIISDLKMPGMNGMALYERISRDDPALAERMVFITGDTMSHGTRAFLQNTGLPYLTKPFTINDLRRVLVRVFSGEGR